MHFDRPDGSLELFVNHNTMTVHINGSVSVVTHKLIELNKTCIDAILNALSTVTKEKRRNKVFILIKWLKCESTVKTLNSHKIIIFM